MQYSLRLSRENALQNRLEQSEHCLVTMQHVLVAILAVTHHEPITFDAFIQDLHSTAIQSTSSNQEIQKTYTQVMHIIHRE